jgi:hypothetical protein
VPLVASELDPSHTPDQINAFSAALCCLEFKFRAVECHPVFSVAYLVPDQCQTTLKMDRRLSIDNLTTLN